MKSELVFFKHIHFHPVLKLGHQWNTGLIDEDCQFLHVLAEFASRAHGRGEVATFKLFINNTTKIIIHRSPFHGEDKQVYRIKNSRSIKLLFMPAYRK